MSASIQYRRHGLVIEEVYFDSTESAPDPSRVDLLRLTEIDTPVTSTVTTPFSTRVIDLRPAEAELLSSLHSNTRNEVRRAMREGVRARACGVGQLPEFRSFYSEFARRKRLPDANHAKLAALAGAGLLQLTCAQRSDGIVLAWHAYVTTGSRSRQLYGATNLAESSSAPERQALGRGHRLLQWFDVTHFRGLGLQELDLGGWYEGDDDKARIRINEFKQKFGGTLVKRFTCWQGLSFKGKCALQVLGVAGAIRNGRAGLARYGARARGDERP